MIEPGKLAIPEMVDEAWTVTATAAACAVLLVMSTPFLRKVVSRVQEYACGVAADHQHHKHCMPLPPGSLGLPCLGESLTLKSQGQKFWISRQQLYGDIFKTHLFGYPSIVVAGPDAARFVMVEQASSFRQRGLPIIEKLLGSSFFGYQHEKVHANFRKILHGPLLPEALERSIPAVEAIAIDILKHWDGKIVNTLEEARKYVFKVAMEFVVGAAPPDEKEELTRACERLIRGVSSLPVNIPGSNYYKAIKESRRKACALLDKIMSFRSWQDENTGKILSNDGAGDILGLMMMLEDENGCNLQVEEIYDNILTFLYSAYDSSAAALCWTIKALTEHPELLAQVQAEHEMISAKKSYDENIKWYDIKEQMQLTIRVIKETLRIANVVEFSYREALEDVPYKGIVFPKGWRVIIAHAAYHMDPKYFPQPQEFDSSRFRVHPKLFSFTPFGSGPHVCMGRELLHLQLLVFIHHLVLKYSWEQHGSEDGSEFLPVHVPKRGFPIQVKRRGKGRSFGSDWKEDPVHKSPFY
ncbi:hypothetical protein KP509_24G078200 [Ceratopteris richardii]|uniref:Cytochrome P450 n=1 Tax=Ceratopteris richardii TaxID=49495 RepID=A0A8T2RWL7_CERRI|nr:hypothetical protein KP509_24G078200 [Ceratopteris richardii]KAH7300761.1 hypothetical protein KP509_24G078200 [Ceratopteris richardii]KAH7300762.1 hypothetical protein KP509_24G078200 [Ceratopteris richardii]KAH7300763.1 hypothetical protein KP509_24G078200 [Ceratopteris richardii]KAH7300764.1 hypothetical protein KP509_24G078200 [Ceratopteris richardii]